MSPLLVPDPRSVFPEGGPPDPCSVFPDGGPPDPCAVISSETLMDALPPEAEAAFHKSSGITMVANLKTRRPLFRARKCVCVDIIDVSRGVEKPWCKKTFPSVGKAPNVPLMPMVDVAKMKMENPKNINMMRDPNNPCQNRSRS